MLNEAGTERFGSDVAGSILLDISDKLLDRVVAEDYYPVLSVGAKGMLKSSN